MLLALIILSLTQLTASYDIHNFLLDFAKHLKSPTKVTCYVCWNKDDIKSFQQSAKKQFLSVLNPTRHVLIRRFPEEHHLYILDMSCKNSQLILHQAQKLKMFNRQFRWLIFGNPFLQDFQFNVDSKIFIAEFNNNEINVKSIYKLGKTMRNNTIAKWTKSQGFLFFNELLFRNRTNLMGLPLNFSYVAVHNGTIHHLWDYRDKHLDSVTKVSYVQVLYLQEIFNITGNALWHKTWGYKDPETNKFNGMYGDVMHGKSVMAVTPGFATTDRIDILELVWPLVNTYCKFIFKEPRLPYITNIYTLPFESYAWYACFLTTFLILTSMYIISQWEMRDKQFQKDLKISGIGQLRPKVMDVALFQLGAITQQGADTEPKSAAGRIAALITLLVLFFLYTAYSANIVALLQSTSDSIRTLDDLLNSRIKLGVEDIVYARYYFKVTRDDPTRRALIDTKIDPNGDMANFIPLEEGMQRMRREFYAYHTELSAAYKIISDEFKESEKCALKEISYLQVFEPYTMSQKNGSYTKHFKIGLLRIREVGIRKREMDKIYLKKPVCSSKGSNFDSVGISDCYAAFEIFGIGVCFSMFMLLGEILIVKHCKGYPQLRNLFRRH